MDPSRYGVPGSRSVSTEPTGFYRGVVKAVDGDTVTVQVPRLFGGAQIPDVPVAGPGLSVDDPVFVSFIEGRRGALLAFAAAGAAAVGDITSVTAGVGISGGGTSGAVTVDFEPSELTTVALAYDDKVVISDDSDSGEPKLVPISEVITTANGDGGEPIGHEDKSESVISFDYSTRTFTIAPVSDSYVVWCAGQKFVKTASESVVIGSSSDLYYISFDADGVLQATTTFFQWDSETPTAYINYNSGEPAKYMLFDERHGIVLDWQTHEYLHRTRGAAIANGFDASNFDVSTQDGSTDDQAYIDIANGTFFDEDLQVDIVHSNTPTANTWEQDLQGPAQIPVFYQSGTTGWTYDAPTNFPLKYGGTPSPTYNLNSGGTWSTPEITSNNYGISWIVATNQLNYPVIAIMGQDFYTNLGDAEAVSWDSMNLDDLPVVELRVLYKVIYRASGSNTPGAYFVEVDDYRRALSSATSTAAAVVDHGNLTGLGDDDHTQYLLVDGSRAADELTVTGDLAVDTDTLFVDATNNRVGINTTSVTAGHVLETRGAVLISSTAGVGNSHFPYTDGRFYYTADPQTGGTGDHVFRHYSGGTYTEQMRILEGGKVGIGTSSPIAGLDIATTAGDTFTTNGWDSGLILNAASALRWREASGINFGIGNSGSTLYFFSSTDSGTGAAADYRMVINGSNGRVGIGDTAPEALLHVNAGTVNLGLLVESTDAGAIIGLKDNTTSGNSHVGIRADGNDLNLRAGNANRVTVTSGGVLQWIVSSGVGGPLTDTSTTSGYRYVLQNQTFGTLYDYTSVRDRKDQITNVTAEDSGRWIDALQPVTYIERWMGEGDEPADAREWREADMQVGFIADDILANDDTDHFSQVLDNGEGGLDPAGWKWECVIAAAVAEIKSLRARVASLEAQ
jgi:hypothetical protein